MPTLTWANKDEAIRLASRLPFRLLENHDALPSGLLGDPRPGMGGNLGRNTHYERWAIHGVCVRVRPLCRV